MHKTRALTAIATLSSLKASHYSEILQTCSGALKRVLTCLGQGVLTCLGQGVLTCLGQGVLTCLGQVPCIRLGHEVCLDSFISYLKSRRKDMLFQKLCVFQKFPTHGFFRISLSKVI